MTSRKKYRPSYSFQSEMAHPSKVYPGARANSKTSRRPSRNAFCTFLERIADPAFWVWKAARRAGPVRQPAEVRASSARIDRRPC